MLKSKIELYSSERVGRIHSDIEFLSELVCLSHLGIKKGEKTAEFHDSSIRLLNYIIETENASLALLLTKTLFEIQEHAKFYLSANATNVRQLCDLVLIQFSDSEAEIYYYVMCLLNYYDESISGVFQSHEKSIGETNIQSILSAKINEMDGNLYESYDLKLTMELLHSYLIINFESVHPLLLDMLSDWDRFEKDLSQENLSKLLWYGFILNQEQLLKDVIVDYDDRLKSDLWSIRFYRYIKQNLSKKEGLDFDKIQRTIVRFKKEKIFSSKEKEVIADKLHSLFEEKRNKVTNRKDKGTKITKSVVRLSSYNIPSSMKLSDIKHIVKVELAVYENKEMQKVIKTIPVLALTDNKKTAVFVNKPMIKQIKEEAKPGFILIEGDLKEKNKNKKNNKASLKIITNGGKRLEGVKLFTWPSTEISGKELAPESDSNGLNEKSDLRKMGYQITDLTREKRWAVLQRAVPALGLRRIAYTIAGFVKMRKGQRNGHKKFRYAIAEWEYDLQRLKNKYYKKDFNWPTT
ncbi:hypothetical protein [Saccharococcus sp. Marseille-Q5394]|uniref:hypothetical protein n=1 Tax=Saccharococcus sp. Marseille-Q5394 TaxID=2972778 RepID=UPI0021C5B657|nr:hypothetical protein [Saccharococcus sp. Marseille-Q5394]